MYEIQSGLTAGEVAFDTEAPFDSMAIGVALENIYLKMTRSEITCCPCINP